MPSIISIIIIRTTITTLLLPYLMHSNCTDTLAPIASVQNSSLTASPMLAISSIMLTPSGLTSGTLTPKSHTSHIEKNSWSSPSSIMINQSHGPVTAKVTIPSTNPIHTIPSLDPYHERNRSQKPVHGQLTPQKSHVENLLCPNQHLLSCLSNIKLIAIDQRFAVLTKTICRRKRNHARRPCNPHRPRRMRRRKRRRSLTKSSRIKSLSCSVNLQPPLPPTLPLKTRQTSLRKQLVMPHSFHHLMPKLLMTNNPPPLYQSPPRLPIYQSSQGPGHPRYQAWEATDRQR